uniref:Lysosomal pro-X carboxypeptidase n=1 Tax=Rhizophora mucronata TaxID=61149 RepID=A0A2P2JB64_RHIMU
MSVNIDCKSSQPSYVCNSSFYGLMSQGVTRYPITFFEY